MYNCQKCSERPALYADLGHDGPPTNFWRQNLITGQELARCPVRDLLDARTRTPAAYAEFQRYITTYYPLYHDGHLLLEGGADSQPARYVEMIALMRSTGERIDSRYLEITKEEK